MEFEFFQLWRFCQFLPDLIAEAARSLCAEEFQPDQEILREVDDRGRFPKKCK